jgi:hypothetical protein
MELNKKENEYNPWKGKDLAIKETFYLTSTQEEAKDIEPVLYKLTINSQDEFLRISSKISQENKFAYGMSKMLGNTHYRIKNIISL